jgi:outer membrane protein OmpA-like peptidoglycan-associated protein
MQTRAFQPTRGAAPDKAPAAASRQAPARQPLPARPRGACACGGSCPRCAAAAAPAPAPPIRRKGIVGAAGDAREREADAVADQVMAAIPRRAAAPGPLRPAAPAIRRSCAACADGEHGAPPAAAAAAADSALRAAARGGTPMVASQRAFFEPRLGADFSQVRIHAGGDAHAAAAGIGARAYTVGRDIVFGRGEYAPGAAGQRLLAHELTHVVQSGGLDTTIRRQPKEPGAGELSEEDAPTGKTLAEKLAPTLVPIPGSVEPVKCPAATNLGNIEPDPPCSVAPTPVDGPAILFCTDSDAFLGQAEADKLRSIAATQPHGTSFQLQAHASIEGPGGGAQARKYNENLSCHRAKRAAHVLMDAGVPESDITLSSGGPTERFGQGVALRHKNRNVVVGTIKPDAPAPAGPVKGGMRGIADTARQRLIDGDYNIGADGYLYRWTCGRWNSLADAVAHTTVRIQGDPGWVVNHEGVEILTGLNEIHLPDELLTEFGGEVECAMARIVDLTFHHFARPNLAIFSQLHKAGAHLVALAGLAGCQKLGAAGMPNAVDPFAGKQPACATNVDTGPLDTKGLPAGPVPVFFGLMQPDAPFSRSGSLLVHGSNAAGAVSAEPDTTPMAFSGTVTTSGKAKQAGAFDIGFVQTALEDENVGTYVGGQKVLRELPLPLRDGAPAGDPNHIEAPWFAAGARKAATPGNTSVAMTDEPNVSGLARFPNLVRTSFAQASNTKKSVVVAPPSHIEQVPSANDPTKMVDATVPGFAEDQPNDIIDRMDRRLEFSTWLVARRRGAALSRDSTQFLTGVRTTLELHPSIVAKPVGAGGLNFSGSGSWTLKAVPAVPDDIGEMRLSGAVPGEFATRFLLTPGGTPLFNEFLRTDEQVAGRDVNGGLHINSWRTEVAKIVDEHRAGKSALLVPMLVTVRVDLATGRTALDNPSTLAGDAVTIKPIAGQPLDPAQAHKLAVEVFPEVRKLVVGFIPGFQNRNTGLTNLAVTLSAQVTP